MTTPAKLPEVFAQHFDALFVALKEAEALLTTGREWGLSIGISPALAAQFELRYGDEATVVLANTYRVDPQKRYERCISHDCRPSGFQVETRSF